MYYHGSVVSALMEIYPDQAWLGWRFTQVPRGFWNNRTNQLAFLAWAHSQSTTKSTTSSSESQFDPTILYSLTAAELSRLGGPYVE